MIDVIVIEIIRGIARHVGTLVFERAARVCITKHRSSAPKRVGERMDVRKMATRGVIVREIARYVGSIAFETLWVRFSNLKHQVCSALF